MIKMNYSVLRTNEVGEKTIIFQTNSYTEAYRVVEHCNKNKLEYGYAGDVYEIIQTDYTFMHKVIKY